jgi:hypothetical protein
MTKITLNTIKSFIRKNPHLYINTKSTFDGMVDGVRDCETQGFTLAQTPDEGRNHKNTLGVQGAWFVFGSRDYFTAYEDDQYTGYEVYNCCGKFILATAK